MRIRRPTVPRLERRGDASAFELLEPAVLGGLVLAPALDVRAVADAPVGDVVEGDPDDQPGPQRDPFEVAAVRPARRLARAALARLVRRERVDQRLLLRGAEAGRVADLAQLA